MNMSSCQAREGLQLRMKLRIPISYWRTGVNLDYLKRSNAMRVLTSARGPSRVSACTTLGKADLPLLAMKMQWRYKATNADRLQKVEKTRRCTVLQNH